VASSWAMNSAVLRWTRHDAHVMKVLRRGAYQRDPADIDVLAQIPLRQPARRVLLPERVEIHDDEIDRIHARFSSSATCSGLSRSARIPA